MFQGLAGAAIQPIITGRYRDEFVRDQGAQHGGWRFARRQFFVDHVGDLSSHLTYSI